jgi:hypothetical protein
MIFVRKAVRSKRFKPATEHACVDCGQQAKVYDHRDYTYPLVVVPVCHRCNLKRWRGKPSDHFKANVQRRLQGLPMRKYTYCLADFMVHYGRLQPDSVLEERLPV